MHRVRHLPRCQPQHPACEHYRRATTLEDRRKNLSTEENTTKRLLAWIWKKLSLSSCQDIIGIFGRIIAGLNQQIYAFLKPDCPKKKYLIKSPRVKQASTIRKFCAHHMHGVRVLGGAALKTVHGLIRIILEASNISDEIFSSVRPPRKIVHVPSPPPALPGRFDLARPHFGGALSRVRHI